MERAALLALDSMFVCMACRMLARITYDMGIPRVASLALRKLLAVRTYVVGIKPAKLGLVGDAACPFEHAILPVHASCWSAAGSTVLLASATEINAGSGFAPCRMGPPPSCPAWSSLRRAAAGHQLQAQPGIIVGGGPARGRVGACQGLAWPSRCDLFYSRPAAPPRHRVVWQRADRAGAAWAAVRRRPAGMPGRRRSGRGSGRCRRRPDAWPRAIGMNLPPLRLRHAK